MKINGSSGGFGRLHSMVSIPLHYVPLQTAPSITTSKEELPKGKNLTLRAG
jgi:hypothetical protein